MSKNILITGGAGFIGFHLATRLVADESVKLTLLDNMNDYYDINLKKRRLEQLERYSDRIQFVKIDLTEVEQIEGLFKENSFDIIINLAAQAGVRYAKKNPRVYLNSNVDGFFNVIDAARKYGGQFLIYASSSSVYGGNETIPFKESDKCTNPLSIYAASKLSDEVIAEAYKNTFGLTCIGLRFFNVYGPWGRPDAVYYKWAEALTSDSEIELRDGGELYRDMTFIDDVTKSIQALIGYATSRKEQGGAFHEIFNIGNESPVRMGDLLEHLEMRLQKKSHKVIVTPRGAEEPVLTRASTDKLKQAIGYAPSTPYKDGVDQFISWFTSYKN